MGESMSEESNLHWGVGGKEIPPSTREGQYSTRVNATFTRMAITAHHGKVNRASSR